MKIQYLIGILVLITAIAAIGFYMLNSKPKPKEIVTVDIKQLIGNLAKSPRYSNLSDDEFKRVSANYINYLDKLLLNLSAQEGLIIMPKQAIVTGAVDITEQVKQLVEEGQYIGFKDENL